MMSKLPGIHTLPSTKSAEDTVKNRTQNEIRDKCKQVVTVI